jgi:hypothetical protein
VTGMFPARSPCQARRASSNSSLVWYGPVQADAHLGVAQLGPGVEGSGRSGIAHGDGRRVLPAPITVRCQRRPEWPVS